MGTFGQPVRSGVIEVKIFKNFMSFDNFWWFLTFSPKWLTFDLYCHDKKCLASKNSGGLVRVTFHESNSKKRFLKIFCKKSWIFVHFYYLFSPELKMLARFCKSQLGRQWVTNHRPVWKRGKNCNYLQKIVKIFTWILKKFWKFSKSKNRIFLKLVFRQKNCFPVPLRPN